MGYRIIMQAKKLLQIEKNKSYNYNSNNHFPLRTLGKPQKKVLLLMAIKRGGGKGRAIKEKITFQHSNGH